MSSVTYMNAKGKLVSVKNAREFTGFYDASGNPLCVGDVVEGSVTYKKSNRTYEQVNHRFMIARSDYSPAFTWKDLGPVGPKRVQKGWIKRTLPSFDAYPKRLFWKMPDGEIANQNLYELIKFVPAKIRYRTIPALTKVEEK